MKIEFRITSSAAGYDLLADDNATAPAIPQKISAYKPALRTHPQIEPLPVGDGSSFANFIYGRSGEVTVSFAVDRQHSSPDDALSFLQQHILGFAVSGTFDLKVTVGGDVVFIPGCAVSRIEPDEHSDQHTFVKYTFTGSTYTDSDQ